MAGKLRWLGLAFVEFTTVDENVILFDPWVKSQGNPSCPLEVEDMRQADLVLASHDHEDHIGSAIDICKKTGAMMGGATETMWRLTEDGMPKEQVVHDGMGYLVGGGTDLGWVKVIATPAHHTSDTGCAMGLLRLHATGQWSITPATRALRQRWRFMPESIQLTWQSCRLAAARWIPIKLRKRSE